MSWSVSRGARNRASASDLLVLFLSFLAGAICFRLGLLEWFAACSFRMSLCLALGAVLLFSASSFGWLFLPLCLFCCGGKLEELASRFVSAIGSGSPPDPAAVVGSVFLVPVFFLAGVHGLNVSAAVEKALFCSSPSVVSDYRLEISRAMLVSLAGFALIFCFY